MTPSPAPPRGEGDGGKIKRKKVMGRNDGNYNTASPDRYLLLKDFAQTNKRFPTDAEKLLWEHIRSRRLYFKFNRQHIIGDYIVDFVCIEKKLVIEVDGGYHSEYEQIGKDELRTERLRELGFSVIRFTNEDVLEKIFDVLNIIKSKLTNE